MQGLVLFFTSLAFLWWFDRCVPHWRGVQQTCTLRSSLASKRGRAGMDVRVQAERQLASAQARHSLPACPNLGWTRRRRCTKRQS